MSKCLQLSLDTKKTSDVGKDVEKLETLCTAMAIEENMAVIHVELLYDSAVLLLMCIYLTKIIENNGLNEIFIHPCP